MEQRVKSMAICNKGLRKRFRFLACVLAVECIFPAMHTDSLAPSVSYEVVIPRRLEPETGKAKKEELSYVIKAAGKEHIIRLKRNHHFVVEHLPVFTYDSEGRRVKSFPYIPAGCYYEGYVEGTADSLVALSTCFGLRGFLKIGDLNYSIEPFVGSRTFQHLLYLTNKNSLNAVIHGLRADDPNHQAEEVGRGKAHLMSPSDVMYIELYVVVTFHMFTLGCSANETRVVHKVLETINLVDKHFRSLNIAVTLVGLDIWKEKDPIKVTANKNAVEDFAAWTIENENKVKRDVTYLFAYAGTYREPQKSYVGGICRRNSSVGIISTHEYEPEHIAINLSYALGRNLGLDPDGPYCFCDTEPNCIMDANDSKHATFSNCSIALFSRRRMQKELDCLRDVPTSVFRFKRCGDKVVDDGEQCDCGEERECKQDPCCNPDCTLRENAICAHEHCCQDCQITPKGMVCRDSVNECDLPEYCTGESMWCPADVHKHDGTPCDQEAFCFAKKCSTHNLHCADIFGKEASAAPQSCFRVLNTAGDLVGNCGDDVEAEKFVKCKEENILCGRLHCSNVKKELHPSTYILSLVRGVSCWTTKFQYGRDLWDSGAVPDGTTCSKKKVCMNRTCVPVSILKSECDPQKKCHGNGVCNNRKNCHCDLGWAPPDCKRPGIGGSVDSGPPMQAYTTYLFSMAFKVVIPVILVGLLVAIPVISKLVSLLNQYRHSRAG